LRGDEDEPETASEGRRSISRPRAAIEQLRSLLSPSHRRRPVELGEDHILSILIARRGRDALFGANLFSDPAWDILLELYAATLGKRSMSPAELSRAINTPASTTGRWLSALEACALIESRSDAILGPGTWIRLTDEGASKIKQLVDHWGAAFLSI
jgi:DNA-binding MarR family transcriptional regulator